MEDYKKGEKIKKAKTGDIKEIGKGDKDE